MWQAVVLKHCHHAQGLLIFAYPFIISFVKLPWSWADSVTHAFVHLLSGVEASCVEASSWSAAGCWSFADVPFRFVANCWEPCRCHAIDVGESNKDERTCNRRTILWAVCVCIYHCISYSLHTRYKEVHARSWLWAMMKMVAGVEHSLSFVLVSQQC